MDYFSNQLGTDIEPQMFTQEDLNLMFDFNCSKNQTKFLALFSIQEIRDVFFSLPRNKTSGPDGYSAEFFTACWHVISPEVTEPV